MTAAPLFGMKVNALAARWWTCASLRSPVRLAVLGGRKDGCWNEVNCRNRKSLWMSILQFEV